MSDPAPLLIEREGAVVRLVLNRLNSGNAVDVALARALMHAAILCDEDTSVRCVVLTGSGKQFCVGGDISAFQAAGDRLGVLISEPCGRERQTGGAPARRRPRRGVGGVGRHGSHDGPDGRDHGGR